MHALSATLTDSGPSCTSEFRHLTAYTDCRLMWCHDLWLQGIVEIGSNRTAKVDLVDELLV